jgi:GR25 family glycosyltransferase involved in LPS biosynthesis
MTAAPANLRNVPTWAINLDKRPDRWDYLTGHLRSRGFAAPKRWPAIDGRATTTAAELARYRRAVPTGTRATAADIGTTKTHLGLIAHLAETDPAPWTLILEDDAAFHRDLHQQWAALAPRLPEDALMVLLGCQHERRPTPLEAGNRRWSRVTRATCAHAYLVTPDVLPLLHAAAAAVTTSFDVAWQDVQRTGRVYAPLPHLAIQREDYSDISGRRRAIRPRHYGLGVA